MPAYIREIAKGLVPVRYRKPVFRQIKRVVYFGMARYCPLCGAQVRYFRTVTWGTPRENAQCPVCNSLERHRLIWHYLQEKTDLFDGRPKKLLHVAPEPQLTQLFRSQKNIDYLSADIENPEAMVKMDITDIQYPDNSFDVIFCSHVLEHVLDDRKAMAEFLRVLKPDGWAILQVPIEREVTYEDPAIITPEDRQRVFGQWDHVRIYGADYKDRLIATGFDVRVDPFVKNLSDRQVRLEGLLRNEDIYFCRKPRPTFAMATAMGAANL